MEANHRHQESSVSPHNSWVHRRAKSSVPYTNATMLAQKLVAQQMSAYVYHQLVQQEGCHSTLDAWGGPAGARSVELCRYRLPKVGGAACASTPARNLVTPVGAVGPEFTSASSMSLRRASTTVVDSGRGRAVAAGRSRRSTGDVTPTGPDGEKVRVLAGTPGHEKVLLTESAAHPDVPVAHRNPDERSGNPDRLSLDRRGLTVCPILEGEENLRLLNYQHNLIGRIQHLSALRKLIFLDLYDNRIDAISGLSSLKSLRVLMLGKNRIARIEGLDALLKLDVLDLHGNDIGELNNLGHLSELRVLNLAGNQLTHVRNLRGLHALTELNLRRNRIRLVEDVDMLPCLQRLFLSFNDIVSWQSVACLADSTSLVELSLDGNPLCREAAYKPTVIRSVPQLKQLDMRRISEEERRMAAAAARKEEERRRETSKTAALKLRHDLSAAKEKRRLAITNARRQWESMQASLLARGTVPMGMGSSAAGGRTGRQPPELYATHVTTVCLPRPQSASLASSTREDKRVRDDVTSHEENEGSSHDEVESARPRSSRSSRSSRPGSARATMAIATVTALPSGVSSCEPVPSHTLESTVDTPSATPHDSGFESSSKTTSVCDTEETSNESRILSDPALSSPGSSHPSCHLAEVQHGDQLHLYAPGSLEALDRQWGLQAAGQITTVRFSFLDFDEIALQLHKLRARFPAVHTLVFHSTNLRQLSQLSALANLRRLEAISVEPEGNPLTQFALWRPFLLFRLSHLGLKRVNGEEVRPGEFLTAERLFSPLSHMTTSQLTQAHLLSLMAEAARRKQQLQATPGLAVGPDIAVGKLGLTYAGEEGRQAGRGAEAGKRAAAEQLMTGLVRDCVTAEENRRALALQWPRLVSALVARAASEHTRH